MKFKVEFTINCNPKAYAVEYGLEDASRREITDDLRQTLNEYAYQAMEQWARDNGFFLDNGEHR